MTPFVLWEVLVVVIFALSFVKLDTVQEAIVALATGYRVVYRTSRVRLYCGMLILAGDEAHVSGLETAVCCLNECSSLSTYKCFTTCVWERVQLHALSSARLVAAY
jgi:hypothetical protein